MIESLAEKIAKYYERQSIIKNHDTELVKYGLFQLLSHIQYLLICLCFGLICHCVLECIVFFLCFSILRMFCGGFHASTEIRCFIVSFIAIVLSIFLIRFFENHDYNLILIVLTIFALIITLLLSPVDNKNKPISITEKKKIHKVVVLIVFIYSSLIILFFKNLLLISISIAISLITSSLFLMLGSLSQFFSKNDWNRVITFVFSAVSFVKKRLVTTSYIKKSLYIKNGTVNKMSHAKSQFMPFGLWTGF